MGETGGYDTRFRLTRVFLNTGREFWRSKCSLAEPLLLCVWAGLVAFYLSDQKDTVLALSALPAIVLVRPLITFFAQFKIEAARRQSERELASAHRANVGIERKKRREFVAALSQRWERILGPEGDTARQKYADPPYAQYPRGALLLSRDLRISAIEAAYSIGWTLHHDAGMAKIASAIPGGQEAVISAAFEQWSSLVRSLEAGDVAGEVEG
jgi:hypothetical protein